MKDLLRVVDLSRPGLARLLNIAAAAKRDPHTWREVYLGDTVACAFEQPRTRARLSFGSAITRLGGIAEVLGPLEFGLGSDELIEDTARAVSRYAAAFVIGTAADADVRRLAAAATIPVVNAQSDMHNPCQALADLLTLQERFGVLPGLKVAYVGPANSVAHSLMEGCALAGIEFAIATPPGYEPDAEVVLTAQRVARDNSAHVEVVNDPVRAVERADAVYTGAWRAAGMSEAERVARARALAPYRVDAALMAGAAPHAIFMHRLPAHRDDEVAAEVIDGSRSVVFDQAENRVYTDLAVLVGLRNGSIAGETEDAARAIWSVA